MKIGALHVGIDSSRNPFVSWHWAWSITWSWGVWIMRGASGRLGFYRIPTCGGAAQHLGLNTPLFSVSYQSQQTMRRASPGKTMARFILKAWFYVCFWPLAGFTRLGDAAHRANSNNAYRACGSKVRATRCKGDGAK